MAEKKLYGDPNEWPLLEDVESTDTILVNKSGNIFYTFLESLKGDKGDKGDSGDVVLPDGLVVSSLGYTLLADESPEEMRSTLELGNVVTRNVGTGADNVVIGSNLRLIPSGLICMWSGNSVSIPSGWILCNGSNGTPDLRDRFIIGAGNNYNHGTVGGNKDAVVVQHTHNVTINSAGNHSHNSVYPSGINMNNSGDDTEDRNWSSTKGESQRVTTSAGEHEHSGVISSIGQTGINANLPPYYALAFIMKV